MFKEYYRLAKPGIIYGNLLTTVAAYLYASRWHIEAADFLATIFGLGLVIASACAFNNYLDRDIDKKMERTKGRALVTGAIAPRSALVFASASGLLGVALLILFVNALATLAALIGSLVYIILYGFSKRASDWGVIVGSVSGAVPIVVGYVAVTDRFDGAALILFLILALWQMPHFFAIATYRSPEYAAAGIPVLPLRKGMRATKVQIVLYIVAFLCAIAALTAFGYAGYSYLTVMGLVTLAWFALGVRGFRSDNDEKWARKLFFFSLIVLIVFCAALSIATILP
jgi:protoheme IX farnesyltransferase